MYWICLDSARFLLWSRKSRMIYLERVTKRFQDTGTEVLQNAELHIRPREMCFLTGSSGAGKTTLLRLITRELQPEEGTIRVNGEDISRLSGRNLPTYRRKIGMVFQDYKLIPDRNIYENVAIAKLITGASEKDILRQVSMALQMVGMEDKYQRYPEELSGGEQQRAGIARAIVNSPYVILADEPTGNLDPQNAREIMLLLERINRTLGTTILIATHDMDAIRGLEHRNIKIERGKIVEGDKVWKEPGL